MARPERTGSSGPEVLVHDLYFVGAFGLDLIDNAVKARCRLRTTRYKRLFVYIVCRFALRFYWLEGLPNDIFFITLGLVRSVTSPNDGISVFTHTVERMYQREWR